MCTPLSKQPVSVEATVNLSHTAESMGISTKISTHVVGLTMTHDQKGLNVNEIQSTLEDFKKSHTPVKHTAILVSYSALNLRAVSLAGEPIEGLEESFKDIFKLLDSIRHARIRQARTAMEEKVLTHAQKLQKIMCEGDVGSIGPKLEAWRRTYLDFAKEYKVWQDRQQLLDESYAALTLNLLHGQ
jgi:hypothetical protein